MKKTDLRPWGDQEIAFWRSQQTIQRSYYDDVIEPLKALSERNFTLKKYGALDHDPNRYPLAVVESAHNSPEKPNIIITGGVHGYETSGVKGAIQFLQNEIHSYTSLFNFIVMPCISPWGYETINRWNIKAQNPNRGFIKNKGVEEADTVMSYFAKTPTLKHAPVLAHIDLHEATESDEKVFEPLKAQRDGFEFEGDHAPIPDGFFVIGDTGKKSSDLNKAIIQSVEKVAHIAKADESGLIYGNEEEQKGVIYTDIDGIAPLYTNPAHAVTTEMYPDSPLYRHSNREEISTLAQIQAIKGALDHLIEERR